MTKIVAEAILDAMREIESVNMHEESRAVLINKLLAIWEAIRG